MMRCPSVVCAQMWIATQSLRVFLALLPDPEIAERAHLVRREIGLALMVSQRDARRIVGQRPESAGLVEWKAAVVGDLRARSSLHEVFVQDRRPVAAQIDRRRLSGCRCGDLRSLPPQCDAEHHESCAYQSSSAFHVTS